MNTPIFDSSPEHWKMYFDGSLNIDGDGVALVFVTGHRIIKE
jgi:hypothetical protein